MSKEILNFLIKCRDCQSVLDFFDIIVKPGHSNSLKRFQIKISYLLLEYLHQISDDY